MAMMGHFFFQHKKKATKSWQPVVVPGEKKVTLLVGPTCKIPRSTQRSCSGIRRVKPKMCHEMTCFGKRNQRVGSWKRSKFLESITRCDVRTKPCLGYTGDEILPSYVGFRTSHYKLYQHRPQIAKTNFCVINVENSVTSARNSRQFVWMPLLRMGAQQWHPPPKLVVTLPSPQLQWHPAMAPLPQSWPSSSPPTTAHNNGSNGTTPPNLAVPPLSRSVAHYNGTLQWHPAMALHPLPPKLVATLPPNHSTLQWHLTVARNGTTSTPPKLVVTLPAPHHSTLQWQPAMAPRPLHQNWSSPSAPQP